MIIGFAILIAGDLLSLVIAPYSIGQLRGDLSIERESPLLQLRPKGAELLF